MHRISWTLALLLAAALPGATQETFLAATLTQVDDDGGALERPMRLRFGDDTVDFHLRLPAEIVFGDDEEDAEEGFDLGAYAAAAEAEFILEGGYYEDAGSLHLMVESVSFVTGGEHSGDEDLAASLTEAARAAAVVEAEMQGISEADLPAFEAQVIGLFLILFEPQALKDELAALFSRPLAVSTEGDTVWLTDEDGDTSRWHMVRTTAVESLSWAQAKRRPGGDALGAWAPSR